MKHIRFSYTLVVLGPVIGVLLQAAATAALEVLFGRGLSSA